MCFSVSLTKYLDYLELRFSAKALPGSSYDVTYYVSAFSRPCMPVITGGDPSPIRFFRWGLVPAWTRDARGADEISLKTLNARSETVFSKPSFSGPVKNRRCLLPADGFFEWRDFGGRKYPYHIRQKSGEVFALAGIWDFWRDPATGEELFTYSVLTAPASGIIEKVHNIKKRMPVILRRADEEKWLDAKAPRGTLEELFRTPPPEDLEARTVSRLITAKDGSANTPAALEPYRYEGLPEL
ncbi:MAG: hypothetical protein A2X49_10250 [Lentisphaerae bacterium GWF2_52_8]|nr:MAG: hypothetical protein A2X49_10250 [Lentisphaerae bacterium GWF2_52_8]